MTKTLSRLYDNYDSALATARDLESAGIAENKIGLLANGVNGSGQPTGKRVDSHGETAGAHAGKDAGLGTVVGGGVGLLSGLGLLVVPGIGPALGLGWLAATAVGAVTGAAVGGAAGGLAGSLAAEGVPEAEAHVYAESIRRGGTVVSVRADDGEVSKVNEILDRHGTVELSSRHEAYRDAGWAAFDPAAEPLDPEEIRRERLRLDPRIPR